MKSENEKNIANSKASPLGRFGGAERYSFKPGTMIYPLPAAMISCGDSEEYNIITVSWMGTICSNPPMCYISVRPERHSYEIIKRTGEFVINLTNEELAYAPDWFGVKSGKDFNKFKKIIPLGSHEMFIADVVNVLADSKYIDAETDKFDLQKAKLIAYSHGHYHKLGEEIGHFGWTVKKKK